ncbi:glycerate kinase, partial [Microbacterium esteraromaticum]
ASGFTPVTVSVTGPTGRQVDATFALRDDEAIIEMAAASGLDVLPDGEKDALGATSRGTGELIVAALDRGATSIVLGVGGSACTDGGAGMLQALGVALRTEDRPVRPGGAGLVDLVSADISGLDPRLDGVSFVLAADVDNPLLGDRGAAAVFAPQKGASADDVAVLEAGLSRLSELVDSLPGVRPSASAPGAGAAGGVGYAALAVLGAVREPGIDVIQRLTGLEARIADADLVITGEGSLDDQSLGGKTPLGVSAAAARAGKPVVAVCGRTTLDAAQATSAGFAKVYALSAIEPEPAKSMANAVPLLREIGRAIGVDAPALLDS